MFCLLTGETLDERSYKDNSNALLVQQHSPTYQEYCALYDKSTKIDTHVD